LAGVGAMAIEPSIRPKEGFHPAKDLAPITLATRSEYGFAVANALHITNLLELVKWAKANPSNAAFGSPGAGSLPHLFGVLFARSAGIDIVHVPFKGGAPLVTDLIGGQIPAGVSPLTDYIEHHKNGKLRLLATSGATRSASTPDVATFIEQGFKEAEATIWFAFWAPAKTPATIVMRRNQEFAKVLQMQDVRERLLKLGQEAVSSTPQELAELMTSEIAKWAPVVKASGFTPDQ
jgi:tripartite-type tricarboxylate transporter receptor subunit TctC